MTSLVTGNPIGYSTQLKDKEKAGEVLILFLFFLGGFAMLTMIFQKKLLLYNEEIEQRIQTYLCFKKTFDSWSGHAAFIEKTNLAIQALNTGIVVKPTPELFQLKKSIQRVQEIRNKLKLLYFMRTNDCMGVQKISLAKTFPIKGRGLKIQRSTFGLALLKDKNQTFLIPSKGTFPAIFTLKGEVRYVPKFHVRSMTEIFHVRSELF